MLRPAVTALCLALTLSGCARLADSRMNPMNWFGNGRQATEATAPQEVRPRVPEGRQVQVVDGRVLIATIDVVEVLRSPSGAILRATGTASRQGYFNAELVLVSVENGTATCDFRVEAPGEFTTDGPAQSRRITVAEPISADELAGIRRIVVRGASNSRSASR